MHGRCKQRNNNEPASMELTTSAVRSSDVTIIGYTYRLGTLPYVCRYPGKNVTLKQFKSILFKEGNFKYFFKRTSDEFGTGVVFEEAFDDNEVLPLWDGKIFALIEPRGEYVDESVGKFVEEDKKGTWKLFCRCWKV